MVTSIHTQAPLIIGNRCWEERVRDAYFNLNVTFKSPQIGSGRLCDRNLGQLGLSNLRSSPSQYLRTHASASESYFLITLPLQSNIHMQQGRKDVYCDSGHILLQHANEPYVFEYAHDNNLWVVKVPCSILRKFIPQPENYTAMSFNGASGIGRLFTQNVLMLGEELLEGRVDEQQQTFYTTHLLSLFAQVLKQDERIVHSELPTIRQAQLYKIQHYMAQHLHNADLNPQSVAEACGISVRYIHSLFKDQNTTFTRYLQQQRLQYAFETLAQQTALSITEVAYQSGFNDQSHFTRLFKQAYQFTPKEVKQQKHIQ